MTIRATRRRSAARGRFVRSTALAACLAGLPAATMAQVAPVPPPPLPTRAATTPVGDPAFTPGANRLDVGVKTTGTIVEWATYGIAAGQTVNYADARGTDPAAGAVRGSSDMTVLNRVVGTGGAAPLLSRIDGSLTADRNIAVYLVNPTGILFGDGAAVNVGALVAGTRAIGDDPFRRGEYRFAGAGTGGVEVAAGASIVATRATRARGDAIDGALGQIALIGAQVSSAGALAAGGDIALVAADDVTIGYDPASPLSVRITRGTAIGSVTTGPNPGRGPVLVRGTVEGRSTLFVAATQQGVTDALLDVGGTVTATGVAATDRGVMLVAGNVGDGGGVAFAGGIATDGAIGIAAGGTLTANGAGNGVRIATTGGVAAATEGAARLSGATGVRATASGGPLVLDAATATGGAVALSSGGALTVATVDAGTSVDVSAPGTVSVTTATARGGTMRLASTGGILDVGTARSRDALALVAGGAARIGSATTTGSTADLSVNAASLRGTAVGTGAVLMSGRDATVDVGGGDARLATLSAAGGIRVDAGSIGAGAVTAATGPVRMTATTGDLTLSMVDAGAGAVDLTARAGVLRATGLVAGTDIDAAGAGVDIGTVTAGRALRVTATATTGPDARLRIAGGTADSVRLDAAAALSVTGTLTAANGLRADAGTTATVATLVATRGDLAIGAGGTLDATTLRAVAGDVRATGADAAVGAIAAATAFVRGDDGAATLGTATVTGGDLRVEATGLATVRGAVSAAGNYRVAAGSIRLGDGTAVLQSADRAVTLVSSDGGISGANGLTLRSDAVPDPAAPGAVRIDATGGAIAFAAGATIQGGTARTGDVTVRLGTAGSALALGGVQARRLTGADAAGAATARLATDGAIDLLGTIDVKRKLDIATGGGSIGTARIAVTDTDADLTLTADGAGRDVIATGALVAPRTLAVAARRDIRFTAATATAGDATLSATTGVIAGTGTLSAGGRARATAGGDVSLGGIASGTRTGAADGSAFASGTGVTIGTVAVRDRLDVAADGDALTVGGGTVGGAARLAKTGGTGALSVTGTLAAAAIAAESATEARIGTLVARTGTLDVRATGAVTGLPVAGGGFGAANLSTDAGAGDLLVRAGTLVRLARAASGAGIAVTAGDPAAATSAGAIDIDDADATGALALVANHAAADATSAGIRLGFGRAGGAATLTGTGRGDIVAPDLSADGTVTIRSAGDARLGRVASTGAGVAVDAANAVTGLTRAAAATDGRADPLHDGATLVAGGAVAASGGGLVQIGAIDAGGRIDVTAGGIASVLGAVTGDDAYAVTGAQVRLGANGTAPAQDVAGAVTLRATGGAVTAAPGLLLSADRDGLGGRDVLIVATGGIDLAGTTLRAGPGRQSAVRVAPGAGGPLVLGAVDARALLSDGSATLLRHDGTATFGAVTVRDTLDIAVANAAGDAALAVASAESLGGDVRLSADGAVTGGDVRAAGLVDVAGRSVDLAAVDAGAGLDLRTTGGTLRAVSATAGGALRLRSAGDLRIGAATATGAIDATAAGDATGLERPGGGFGGTTFGGDAGLTVTSTATGPDSGLVRIATAVMGGGVAITGRRVEADALTGAAVTVTARRAAAGVPAVGIAIGTVDAGGAILLDSGGGTPFAGGSGGIAIDRATSTAGTITLTDRDGGLGARDPALRTTLLARGSAGTVAVDVAGAARLATAEAGQSVTLAAASLDATRIAAGTTLTATARSGDLSLDTALSGQAMRLSATAGAIRATMLTAGGLLDAAAGTGGLRIDAGDAGGDVRLLSAGRIDVRTLVGRGAVLLDAAGAIGGGTVGAAADLTARGDAIDLSAANAAGGALSLTARGGDLRIVTGTAGRDATLSAGGSAMLGTLTAGGALDLRARRIDAGTLRAATIATQGTDDSRFTALTSARATTIATGTTLTIGTLDAGTDAALTAGGAIMATRLTAGDALAATGSALAIGAATATRGALALTAGTGDLSLDTGRAGAAATLRADNGLARIGTLDAAAVAVRAARIAGDAVAATGAVETAATGDARLASVRSGGDATVSAGGALSLGTLDAGGTATLTAGGAFDATRLAAGGALTLAANGGGIALGTATAGAAATLTARGAIRAETLAAGTTLSVFADGGDIRLDTGSANGDIRLAASAGAIDVATLSSRDGAVALNARDAIRGGTITATRDLTARGGAIAIATVGGAPLSLTATAGDLTLGDVRTAGDAALTASAAVTVGTFDGRGPVTIRAARIAATDLRADGGVDAAATGDARFDRLSTSGTALLAAGGGLMLGTATAGAGATLTANAIAIGTLETRGTATLRAAAVAADAIRAGALLDAAATGDARYGRIDADDRLRLSAGGDLTLGTGIARDAALDAGGVARIARLDASGGPVALTAGRIEAGTLAGGDVTASARGAARFDTVTAGGALRLTSGGTLDAGTLLSGGTADFDANPPTAIGGTPVDAVLTAGTDLTIGRAESALGSLRLTAGGRVQAQRLRAAASIGLTGAAIAAEDMVAATGSVAADAAGALAIGRLGAGQAAMLTAGGIDLGSATTGGALILAATGDAVVRGAVAAGGDYRVEAAGVMLGTAGATLRQASGGAVAIVARDGGIAGNGALTLASGAGGIALTATGANGAVALAPETMLAGGGDIAVTAAGTLALGSANAPGRTITLAARDMTLAAPVAAATIAIAGRDPAALTRLGDAPGDNDAEFADAGTRLDLTAAEVGRLSADTVTLDGGAGPVRIGALAIGAATGATRFAIRTTGRIDVLGRVTADGSPGTRTILIGGDGGEASRAAVIRVAATQAGGGRLLVGGATLDLRGDRIGVGLDAGFLSPLGFGDAAGLPVAEVTARYIGQSNSALYDPVATGQPAYTDRTLVAAGSLVARYGRYALFQNTGRAGEGAGVAIGAASPTTGAQGSLRLAAAAGGSTNGFALFGTVNGIGSTATALLGGNALRVDPTVTRGNSRANGCVIGAGGGGCLATSIAQPAIGIFDSSRSEIFRTADDLSLPFDPLVGTNNESLFSDVGGSEPPAATCGTADTPPCRPAA